MATRTEYICDNCGDSAAASSFINLYSAKMLPGYESGMPVKAELCDGCAYKAVVHALNGKKFVCGPIGATEEVKTCRTCGKPIINDYHRCPGLFSNTSPSC